MTRSAPVLTFRQPVMTPVPLFGIAPYAADPTPLSTAAAATALAAYFCFLESNTGFSYSVQYDNCSLDCLRESDRYLATTTRSDGVSCGGRGGASNCP